MSLNKANFLKTLWAASLIVLWTQSCNLHKNLSSWWTDSKEKSLAVKEKGEEQQNKAYSRLVRKLAKEYSKSTDGWHYHGKKTEKFEKIYSRNESWESVQVNGKMKDFYTERFHSNGEKGDSTINHTEGEWSFFSKRELFYQQILSWYGNGKYGLIIKFNWESGDEAYKVYDTIEKTDFDDKIKKTENSPLVWSQENSWFNSSGWKIDFKTHVSMFCSQEEKMLWLLPELYYNQIKGHRYETYGTLVDKPSDKILRFADKHWFVLKPKIFVLRDMDSYLNPTDHIELRWVYMRVPEKKVQTTWWEYHPPKDTIPQTTTEQIKETEKQMNEIFEYGQKVIFHGNSKEFKDKDVEKWLDKLYEMLEKNPSLKIKVTGYYGWVHPTLPLERAEKVKQYLVKKWIAANRIQTEWWKEPIAKSIKIEIIK